MARRPASAWSGWGTAWAFTSMLLAGILVWGGLGYLADRLIGLRWLFTPIGILLGTAGGIYLAYVRYGREDHET